MTKEEIKVYNKAYREANKEKMKAQSKAWKEANKDTLKAKNKVYREANKEKMKDYKKVYNKANKDKIKAYQKAYKPSYKKANRDKIREYQKQKTFTDPLFKMSRNLRCRTYHAFKNGGYKKNTKTAETLGASYQEVFDHIENLFTEGMEWSNQGEWHIDHIVPLSSAKTKEELISLCHYTNLQPLWAEDNLVKGAKLDWKSA